MTESAKSAENHPIAPAHIDSGELGSDAPASDDPVSNDPAQPSLPKIVPFTDLARCGDEIWISHQGQLYRLQSTKAGKLILTK